MRKQLSILALIALFLVVIDLAVAGFLTLAEGRGGKAQTAVRYFEYGRSVPGKLERWLARPELRDNIFDVAWVSDTLAASESDFATEPPHSGPVVRAYGMSFVAQILRAAEDREPSLSIDLHGGPAAPPNLVYELFLRDRDNRRPGEIVVFGILSSSVPAMAALSNRTWSFEQPAPLTYPIFLPEDENGLRRIAPLVDSPMTQRRFIRDPDSPEAQAWEKQLRREDRLWTAAAFSWPVLDNSPLLRLIRRSVATRAIDNREAALKRAPTENGFPYVETLQRMIADVVRIAREDGQTPVVFLIQSRDPQDFDLFDMTRTVLGDTDTAYLATVDHADPRDPAGFASDGHYLSRVNETFGAAFLQVMRARGLLN